MKSLGKVALVTGAARGIGKEIVYTLAESGYDVSINYRTKTTEIEQMKEELESKYKIKCALVQGDVASFEDTEKIVNQTVEALGKIDILVNNAGVQYQQKKLDDISNEQFDFTLKSNIYSMFYLTKAALPYMESGSIINTTSITTFYGEPELIDYVTSKGAIVGFTRALSTNLATKGIRVNAISPGVFWTPLQPACWEPNKIPTLGSDSDMKRMANPYEIAPAYVYLASDDSTYTTGQVIHVNGGQLKG